VEIKGAQAQFIAKTIYITSNKLPWEWYAPEVMKNYSMSALLRRIDKFVWCTEKNNFQVKNEREKRD